MRDDARFDVLVKFNVLIRPSLFESEQPHFGSICEEEQCKDDDFPCICVWMDPCVRSLFWVLTPVNICWLLVPWKQSEKFKNLVENYD